MLISKKQFCSIASGLVIASLITILSSYPKDKVVVRDIGELVVGGNPEEIGRQVGREIGEQVEIEDDGQVGREIGGQVGREISEQVGEAIRKPAKDTAGIRQRVPFSSQYDTED